MLRRLFASGGGGGVGVKTLLRRAQSTAPPPPLPPLPPPLPPLRGSATGAALLLPARTPTPVRLLVLANIGGWVAYLVTTKGGADDAAVQAFRRRWGLSLANAAGGGGLAPLPLLRAALYHESGLQLAVDSLVIASAGALVVAAAPWGPLTFTTVYTLSSLAGCGSFLADQWARSVAIMQLEQPLLWQRFVRSAADLAAALGYPLTPEDRVRLSQGGPPGAAVTDSPAEMAHALAAEAEQQEEEEETGEMGEGEGGRAAARSRRGPHSHSPHHAHAHAHAHGGASVAGREAAAGAGPLGGSRSGSRSGSGSGSAAASYDVIERKRADAAAAFSAALRETPDVWRTVSATASGAGAGAAGLATYAACALAPLRPALLLLPAAIILIEGWLARHTPVLLEGPVPGLPGQQQQGQGERDYRSHPHAHHHPVTGVRYAVAGHAAYYGGAVMGVALFVSGRAGMAVSMLARRALGRTAPAGGWLARPRW